MVKVNKKSLNCGVWGCLSQLQNMLALVFTHILSNKLWKTKCDIDLYGQRY